MCVTEHLHFVVGILDNFHGINQFNKMKSCNIFIQCKA